MQNIEAWLWLRCLKSGKFYPDYAGGAERVGLRYCGDGDLIFVKPEDIQWLLDGGLCEHFVYEYRKKAE
jgi:hypothetical protein